MEGGHANELYSTGYYVNDLSFILVIYPPRERPKQRLDHQKYEERSRNWRIREPQYDDSTNESEHEARPKRPDPRTQRTFTAGPARGQVPAEDLEGKIDEHCDGKVLLAETLLDHLERCSGLMRRPANFRKQVHTEGRLDVCSRVRTEMGLRVSEDVRLSFTIFQIVL